jgi:hypothetical protein
LLRVSAERAIELLCDRVLDPDALDLLIESREVVAPKHIVSACARFTLTDQMSTHHSSGGMTLTIPDFIPYLSTFSINFLKLLNCAIVGLNTGMLPPSQ